MGAAIRGLVTKTCAMTPSLRAQTPMIDLANPTIIRVSLACLFRRRSRPQRVSSTVGVVLVRVRVRGVHIRVLQAMVADLHIVMLLRIVLIVVSLVTDPKSVPDVG